jgi:hypothetical protein
VSEVVRQIAPILIEVLLFQGAYLLFPESSPWRRPTAVGLIVMAIVTAILIYGPVRSAPVISLPSPLPFAVVALASSVLAAVGQEAYRDLSVKHKLRRLSMDMADWSVVWDARREAARRTTTEKLAIEKFQQQSELHDKFNKRISVIFRDYNKLPPPIPSHIEGATLLTMSNDAAGVARGAAGFLRSTAHQLPYTRHWAKRRRFRLTLLLFLLGITLLWAILRAVSGEQESFDPREIPPNKIESFKASLPAYDPSQSITVFCFPDDPSSCKIAKQYQSWLADHWNMRLGGPFPETSTDPALINRVWIYTDPAYIRPPGATALHKALGKMGLNMDDPGYRTRTLMGPNAFGFAVGRSH